MREHLLVAHADPRLLRESALDGHLADQVRHLRVHDLHDLGGLSSVRIERCAGTTLDKDFLPGRVLNLLTIRNEHTALVPVEGASAPIRETIAFPKTASGSRSRT